MTYADKEYYLTHHDGLSETECERWLDTASTQIDLLTYRRVIGVGFDKLHQWQQSIVKEVACAHAEWLHENQDTLETYLKSYAINGVAMTFDGAWNVHIDRGVAMRSDLYSLLASTGLCTLSFNWGSCLHG